MSSMLWFVCPLVFLAGFMDAIAGGGGLISLPVYYATGIPAHMALGTNKISSTACALFSSIRFFRNGKVHLKATGVSVVFALVGSALGAQLALFLDEKYLRYFLIGSLPILFVFVLTRRNFGLQAKIDTMKASKVYLLCAVFSFIIGAYDGFFGPGTGMFMILVFVSMVGFDMVTASGNAKLVNLASNFAAVITYIVHGKVVWSLGLPAAVFAIAGGWIGSGLAIKNGAKIIRPVFIFVVCLLFVKIVLDVIGIKLA